MKIGTYIYSSQSVEKLKEMLNEFSITFNIPSISLDKMFYYGVFCKDITYANFKHWDEAPERLEIPENLTAPCQTEEERLDYVHYITNLIIRGEIEKPEWMLYVEMEESCNEYDAAPSTFLYIISKEDKYKALADKILEFLYSPNLVDYTYRFYN